MSTVLFSAAVAAGHTYKSRPMLNGVRQHIFDGDYAFTGGAVAGTLYVDRSSSGAALIKADQGGDNVTDLATWRQYKRLYDEDGTQYDAITVAAAFADFLTLVDVGADAVRFRFVASGAGTWVMNGSSREA